MNKNWAVKMQNGEVAYIYTRDPQEAVRKALAMGYTNIYGVIGCVD